MSFAGSLILTGLGAFTYKYDHAQQFERLPDSQLAIGGGFNIIKKEIQSWTTRIQKASGSFVNEFFDGSSCLYPYRGIVMFWSNKTEYSLPILGVVSIYLLMFFIVSVVYWGTITPVYTSLVAILGPPAMILVWVHSVLHANMLTMMFMRLCHFNNLLVTRTLRLKGLQQVHNKDPVKYYVPVSTLYFWIFYLPSKLIKYLLGCLVLVILLLISAFPILGPVAFNLLISPFIAKAYVTKILRLRGFNNIERNKLFYDHFGQYTAFGSAAELPENIPLLAGFALCTNTIGGALWGIDLNH